LRWSKKCGA